MPEAPDTRIDLLALTLVMEGRLALHDAVVVLMVKQALDRADATEALVCAAAFASDTYGGAPLDRYVSSLL